MVSSLFQNNSSSGWKACWRVVAAKLSEDFGEKIRTTYRINLKFQFILEFGQFYSQAKMGWSQCQMSFFSYVKAYRGSKRVHNRVSSAVKLSVYVCGMSPKVIRYPEKYVNQVNWSSFALISVLQRWQSVSAVAQFLQAPWPQGMKTKRSVRL